MNFYGENFDNFSIEERINLAKKHTKYFDKEFSEKKRTAKNLECKRTEIFRLKNFALLKKFFKIYINGFDGAKDLRMELMNAKNKKEIFKICDNFLNNKI